MPQLDSTADAPASLHLGPGDADRLISANDFAAASFAEPYTYERTEGRLRVMSPEGHEHVRAANPWLSRLFLYAGANPDLVQAVVPAAWIVVDDRIDRIADVGVYLGNSLADLNIPRQIPDLVIEIVSPGRRNRERDYITKRAEYEQIGVREYLIVDRFERRVTALTLVDGRFAERTITPGGHYETPLLPGLVIPLSDVGLV